MKMTRAAIEFSFLKVPKWVFDLSASAHEVSPVKKKDNQILTWVNGISSQSEEAFFSLKLN